MTGTALDIALAWLDRLIHREMLRLRARYDLSLDEFRGLYISDAQADALLERTAPQTPAMLQQEIERAQLRAFAALQADDAWSAMCAACDLDPFESFTVLCALAPEIEPKYATLYAYLNDAVSRAYLTPWLALRLTGHPPLHAARQRLSASGNLRRLGLLEPLPGDASEALSLHQGLILSPVAVGHLLRLAPGRTDPWVPAATGDPVPWTELPLPPDLVARLIASVGGASPVALTGAPNDGRLVFAWNALAGLNVPVAELDLAALCSEVDAETAVQRCALAIRLGGMAAAIHGLPEAPDRAARQAVDRIVQAARATVLLADSGQLVRAVAPGAEQIAVPPLNAAGRECAWRYHLHRRGVAADPPVLARVADLFALPFDAIGEAADSYAARLAVAADPARASACLAAAARDRSSGVIAARAEKVRDGYRLSDLVLPPIVRSRIDDFIAATHHRRTVFESWGMQRRLGAARGLAALFTGASGTGKSMAASAIAKALELDLFRIELSAIVSKYIGETEKNLDAVFNAAAEANCILFFDEADALFGKRSEVKDAHDRYANIECAYLLQKMERHDGIVILTTNLPRSIDSAFSRRIQFAIDFPRPDADLRERLWQGMFPDHVPLDPDVDFTFLARNFDHTGGEIRNIALDAALRAAQRRVPVIDMRLLLKAVERGMVKQGKAPTAMQFKQHFKLVAQSGV